MELDYPLNQQGYHPKPVIPQEIRSFPPENASLPQEDVTVEVNEPIQKKKAAQKKKPIQQKNE